MRKLVLILFLCTFGALPATASQAAPSLDPVARWNGSALAAVRVLRASDADAARLYAMLNVAVYDAVNGVDSGHSRRAHALVPGPGPRSAARHADPSAAAVAAAHAVMAGADSARASQYDAQLAADLAAIRPGPKRDAGVAWGRSVGQRVLAARADDGSTPVETQPGGTGPGVFPVAWSGVQYRNVRPFALADPAAHVLGPQPGLITLDYAAAFAEVALLGNAAIPAPDKLATFQFWSVPAGTDQPAGEWLKIALTVSASRHLDLAGGSRLFALLTMTLSDTSIPTVATKFNNRHWRPQHGIQQADTDGNPLTTADTGWLARAGGAGSTPEWVSGHSSYSGAGASVLAGFFCADRIPFEALTDTAPGGVPRSYPGFSAAAAEAGRSRVFGGQHFEFSNQAGLGLGRGVGAEVLRTALLLKDGPTHRGECPR